MKRALIAIVFVLLCAPIAFAERLVCDIPTEDIGACEVKVDGVLQVDGSGPSLCSMDAGPSGPVIRIYTNPEDNQDYMELIDEPIVATYVAGQHVFEARVQHRSGWWSNWSSPLNAEKPGILGNVKVVE